MGNVIVRIVTNKDILQLRSIYPALTGSKPPTSKLRFIGSLSGR